MKSDISFNGKNRECQIGLTAYGDKIIRLIDMVQLTSEKDYQNPYNFFKKLCQDCPALYHGDRRLIDHFEVNWNYY
jgi:hypothetical protein